LKIYKNISLYFNTIKFLRFSQIIYRFLLRVPKNYSFSKKRPIPKIRFSNAPLVKSVKYSRTIISKNTFVFLNKKIHDYSSNLWNNKNLPKLWLYNLHYFNDLRLLDDSYSDTIIKETLAEWINDNPFGDGVGWEPYPLSIRIVNIIKWQSNKKIDLDFSLIKSLVMQVRYLEKNLEYHLKGNHLFSNAKALIFAGYFFEGDEALVWFRKGIKILESEMREQILDDGGHYERSTMYHALALEDFLDLKNIILSNSKIFKEYKSFIADIDNIIDRMIFWLKTMTHPDGNISFFNDAAFNIAASPKDLLSYASRLNYKSSENLEEVTYLKNSGYIRVNIDNISLFVDVAPLGPDYLLAHAHADSLSYEFSYKKQRIVVNSGTSHYEKGKNRDFERGTTSHSTLEIDSENSSEVWHSFRVAKRARIFDISITHKNKNIEISAKHDGYLRLKRGAVHTRKWIVNKKSLEIIDSIDGGFSKAVSRHYIHPDISISNSNEERVITLRNSDNIFWDTNSDLVNLKSSEWYPEFGTAIKNKCLNISINPDTSIAECNIRFTLH
jgi:uncharacterized heparinase superfamily protein